MIVLVSRTRVTSGNADVLAALDEALRQLPVGVHLATRPILAGGRETLGEVVP